MGVGVRVKFSFEGSPRVGCGRTKGVYSSIDVQLVTPILASKEKRGYGTSENKIGLAP